jgi:acetyl-CoA carboxylase biotin carboxyl carrier protein
MTIDEIRQLIALAAESGIAELEVQRGDDRVRIRRSAFGSAQEIVLTQPAYAPIAVPAAVAQAAAPAASASPVAASIPAVESPKEKPADPNVILVKSPIVGTFYESPSPESPAFVSVGDRVQPGKVLCIIESMKLMNEIEAETAGIIESKLVLNGQPVEYGEALFAVRPL